MRTLFAIYSQKVPIFIKYSDEILESYNLKFSLMYRAFETSDFKLHWSRHLDEYVHSLFCSVNDLIKLNIFNPYKKIIKLNDLSGSYVAYNIINSFACQRQSYFDEIVFCCYVHGLEETYVMAPKTTSDALNIALAMKMGDDGKAQEKLEKNRRVFQTRKSKKKRDDDKWV